MSFQLIIFGALVMSTMAQRPSFAGSRPASGYKDGYIQQTSTNNNNDNSGGGSFIGSRTVESDSSRLPSINSNLPYWPLNQQRLPSGSNQFNGLGFPTRSNADGNVSPFNGFTQPIGNNPNSIAQLPGVVYPSNITPQQQINMEIQFLQQRLNGLIQAQNQLQQRNNGEQITGRLR